MSRVNAPDSPGVRFSCSPRMWVRSAVRSSASETASAPLLATLNVTSPAAILAGRGVQPCGVRSIATVLALLADGEPPPEACVLAHPAASSASPATLATTAVRRGDRPGRLPRLL